jgi:hypothetical protein
MKWLILVLAAQSIFAAEFVTDIKKHVVFQPKANLIWQDDTSSADRVMSYKSAMAYCETLNHAEYTNWRLPTVPEFQKIVDMERIPTISAVFSNTATQCYWFNHRDNSGLVGIGFIDFSNGTKQTVFGHEHFCHARCVSDIK